MTTVGQHKGVFGVIELFCILIMVIDTQIELYTPRSLILPYIKNKTKKDLFLLFFLLYLYEKMDVS